MKFIPFLLTTFIAFISTREATAQMVPLVERVRVEVRVNTNIDEKDMKKTATDRITQHKTLEIKLSGKAKTPETRTVKWTAYGRNERNEDVVVVSSGESPLALDSRGTASFKSEKITTTYTPAHTVQKNPRLGTARRVDGSGVKFLGYSVKVFDGGNVVGEFSEPTNVGVKK